MTNRSVRPARGATSYGSPDNWRVEARCADGNPRTAALFSGHQTMRTAIPVINEFCHKCPVMAECHTWAKSEPLFIGVAGGALFRGRNTRARIMYPRSSSGQVQ